MTATTIVNGPRTFCDYCDKDVTRYTVLRLEGARAVVLELCGECLEGLRQLIKPEPKPRPLSKRSFRALEFLATNPRPRGSWDEVRAAVGTYATNVMKALLVRGYVEQHGGPRYPDSEFSITSEGVAKLLHIVGVEPHPPVDVGSGG